MPTHYTEIRRTFDSPYTTAATDATTGQYRATPRSELTITIKLTVDSRAGLKSAVDELKTDLASDPDDANYDLIAVSGRRIGNAYAIVAVPFVKNDYPAIAAWRVPPAMYVTTKIRTRWLPTVSGGGAYTSAPHVAVFGGRMLERPFKQLEAIIRIRGASQSAPLDLGGGANIDNVNTDEWYGLDAKHVYYAGMPQCTGYQVGSTWGFEPWHVFIYRRWLDPKPNGVEPHDEVYVDENGVIQLVPASDAAIETPL